jgi:hypothetical protein
LVEKLSLPTLKHLNPYRLQWLNDGGYIKVTKQVIISFSIGKYKDEVLCDVAPMHAGHLLLGRPWQFDRKVKHDGYKNRYTLVLNNRIIVLTPLQPIEAYADQIRISKKCSDLRTNPLEEGENDEIMNPLSMWKETYKK